ncbi:hypothetical protein CJI59_32745 [Streptomyces sp. Alain-F2R5]|nr:condensation domain-containing protein [Streptomyces sp. Alain-F2R5]PAM97740.1 hypothetical protein CJI59_32745 [Streptomyces sp. Alain-F2R5]
MTTGEVRTGGQVDSRGTADGGGSVDGAGSVDGGGSVVGGGSVDSRREALVRARLAGGRGGRRAAVTPVDRDGPLALSHGQQQMWFLSRLDPDSWEYSVPVVLRLRGRLSTEPLRRGFEELVARHEILRTRYALDGTDPVQLIDPPGRSTSPSTTSPAPAPPPSARSGPAGWPRPNRAARSTWPVAPRCGRG